VHIHVTGIDIHTICTYSPLLRSAGWLYVHIVNHLLRSQTSSRYGHVLLSWSCIQGNLPQHTAADWSTQMDPFTATPPEMARAK
jgi:hypothetical protein